MSNHIWQYDCRLRYSELQLSYTHRFQCFTTKKGETTFLGRFSRVCTPSPPHSTYLKHSLKISHRSTGIPATRDPVPSDSANCIMVRWLSRIYHISCCMLFHSFSENDYSNSERFYSEVVPCSFETWTWISRFPESISGRYIPLQRWLGALHKVPNYRYSWHRQENPLMQWLSHLYFRTNSVLVTLSTNEIIIPHNYKRVKRFLKIF